MCKVHAPASALYAKSRGNSIFLRSNDTASLGGESLVCAGQQQALLGPLTGSASPQIQQVQHPEAHQGPGMAVTPTRRPWLAV